MTVTIVADGVALAHVGGSSKHLGDALAHVGGALTHRRSDT